MLNFRGFDVKKKLVSHFRRINKIPGMIRYFQVRIIKSRECTFHFIDSIPIIYMLKTNSSLSICLLFSLFLISFQGCSPSDPNADVADIQLDIDFKRVDVQLAKAAQGIELGQSYMEVYQQELRNDRDFLFYYAGVDLINEDLKRRGEPPVPEPLIDSIIAFKLGPLLADSTFYWLLDTLQTAFPHQGEDIFTKIEPLFKRYHTYFPEVKIPAIRTHVNGYDPSGHPQSVDQLLITEDYFSIGLHYFMGENFNYYSPNLPQYVRRRFDPAYMEIVIAHQLAEGTVLPLRLREQPSLLTKMIREGIKLHMVQKLLPAMPDSMIIMYSQEEMAWTNALEKDIYKDLTPKFFSTNFMDHRSYLAERPFTHEVSIASAPRLGQFVGWKIVQAYVDKKGSVSLADLCTETDYEKIFRESKYKP